MARVSSPPKETAAFPVTPWKGARSAPVRAVSERSAASTWKPKWFPRKLTSTTGAVPVFERSKIR